MKGLDPVRPDMAILPDAISPARERACPLRAAGQASPPTTNFQFVGLPPHGGGSSSFSEHSRAIGCPARAGGRSV